VKLTIGGAVLEAALLVMGGIYFLQWREHSRLENELADAQRNSSPQRQGQGGRQAQNKIKISAARTRSLRILAKESGTCTVLEAFPATQPASG
jgi:hypothetical protein